MSGETRKKVHLGELIEWMLEEIRNIDADESLERKEKTKKTARLAKRFKTQLHDDGRRKDEDKIAVSTYRRYMTEARKAVTAQNWRHHSLDQQIERLAKRYPKYADRLERLGTLATISEIRLAHRELLDRIRDDDQAYEDIRAMKLDHEIMRHLTLSSAQKAELAESATDTLEERAVNTVEINYHWLMDQVYTLLTNRERVIDGEYRPFYSHLALGLALATGRRSIEVLKTGRIKKVDRHQVEFSGQAKKRGGVDYSQAYHIYTLVDADLVVEAWNELRSLPEVVELQGMDNTEINRRTAKTLNTLAKRVFDDEERVFKDSRAIWARLVFEMHFSRDKRWKKVTEDVFWREMLGHEDMDTQRSYRAFKIDYSEGPASAEREPAGGHASRLEALRALDGAEELQASQAMARVHNWVKEQVEQEPEAKITQSLISRELGTYRPTIKAYLELAGEALETPNVALARVAAPVPEEVARPKIRVGARELGGRWVGVASVNGVEVARVDDMPSREEAMRAAYTAAGGR
ncbi:telomere resolvase [Spirulina subsalsa FACHB-351]|uniref:Telomere resolvase n=1 Tax=Spirulina subsalsa FACHB-351 TaxID=234711 RepID=A0ABT3L5K4_9CYAN|nr:telomere resolvase [Spirulina subsalsa]MCW6036798.1 telomere resolvase [Spirulina subsalsa FACHB-351]